MERIEQHQVGIRTLLERGVPRPPTNTSSLNASSKMGHTAQGFGPGMKTHENTMNRTQSSFGGTHSGNQWLNQAQLGIAFSPNNTGRSLHSQQSAPVGVIGVAISPNNRSLNGGNSQQLNTMNQSQMSHASKTSQSSDGRGGDKYDSPNNTMRSGDRMGGAQGGGGHSNQPSHQGSKSANNTREGFFQDESGPDAVSINMDQSPSKNVPGGVSPIDENEQKYAQPNNKSGNKYRVAPDDR